MASGHAGPTEVEVKLGVEEPTALLDVLESAAPDAGSLGGFAPVEAAHTVVVVDRYIDTEAQDGVLERAGTRARIRERDGVRLVTVKDEGRRDGDVHRRTELEAPAGPGLDPRAWPPSAARDRLLELVGDAPLSVVAALRQDRRTRRLARGATLVELSLDAMAALGEDDRVLATRTELEAELVGGEAADLADLAAALRRLPGIAEPLGSKLRFAREARAAREPRRAETER